jgi:hypothetical protein
MRRRNTTASFGPLDSLAAMLHAWIEDTDITVITPTCLTCAHLPKNGVGCLKYKLAAVPAKVVVGQVPCEGYLDISEAIPY